MTTSETTERKRDLHADLAICSAATAGPRKARGWTVPTADQYNVGSTYDDSELFTAWQGVRYPGGPEVSAEQARLNAIFASEARTGWPHAIERAIITEEQVGALIELLREATDFIIPNESDYKCDYRCEYINRQIAKIVPEVGEDE